MTEVVLFILLALMATGTMLFCFELLDSLEKERKVNCISVCVGVFLVLLGAAGMIIVLAIWKTM